MSAPGSPQVAVPVPVRRPGTVLAAGVLTIAGAVVGLLLPLGLSDLASRLLYPLLGERPPDRLAELVFLLVHAVALGIPALQLAGAARLLSGRGRGLLLLTGPVSLLGVGWAVAQLVDRPDDAGWQVLAVLSALPVAGALLAVLPPAARWVGAGSRRPGAAGAPSGDRMPATAVIAVVLGLVGSAVPLFSGLVAVVGRLVIGDQGGDDEPIARLALQVGLLAATTVGALLLLGRRSWAALALPAAGYCLVAGLETGWLLLLGLSVVFPAGAAVLAVLPSVRRWVATRPGGGTRDASRAS